MCLGNAGRLLHKSIRVCKFEGILPVHAFQSMRVIHQRKKKYTTLVILLVGITSLGIAIGGAVSGNPILIGAGVAGFVLTCAMAVNLKKPVQTIV